MEWRGRQVGVWLWRGSPHGEETVLDLPCIRVNILVVTLCYRFADITPGGNQKEDMQYLSVLFLKTTHESIMISK